MSTAKEQPMKEQYTPIAEWAATPQPKPSRNGFYSTDDCERVPPDYERIVRELALRVQTLQSASRRVVLSYTDERLKLATVVMVPAPPPPAPEKPDAKPDAATPAKRRRPTRRVRKS